MNTDFHVAEDLKNPRKCNLYFMFNEPDIDLLKVTDGKIGKTVKGEDSFGSRTGETQSDGPRSIARWFIDTDYSEESSFARPTYFQGAVNP